MPICRVGGANCKNGSLEEVEAHEREVHGMNIGPKVKRPNSTPIIVPSFHEEIDHYKSTMLSKYQLESAVRRVSRNMKNKCK